MVRSLPSRTAAIIPQPHEQKLHEVVNSLTSESFRSLVAARTSETSRRPPSASPAPPPRVSLSRSRRLTADCGSGAFSDSSMSSPRHEHAPVRQPELQSPGNVSWCQPPGGLSGIVHGTAIGPWSHQEGLVAPAGTTRYAAAATTTRQSTAGAAVLSSRSTRQDSRAIHCSCRLQALTLLEP